MEVLIKRSKKRSTWQIKTSDHSIHHLGHFESLLKPVLRALGIDADDSSVFVKMTFDAEAFDGYQLRLSRLDDVQAEPPAFGACYHIESSAIGDELRGIRGFVHPWVLKHVGLSHEIHMSFVETHERWLLPE
ncbi:MAG: hypothetical protein EA382_07915 [Spirochaetaceae bacterium]|nr:MAG: hypothetical protein EA382_07915 [Spirochaetaceae bacterium]